MELALDWTPNTNHTGIFVARAKGYYDDADVDLTIRSPAVDDYETTPAQLVAGGDATVGIAPSESALSYHTHPDYPSLVAIGALCQHDTSAIVTLESSGLDRPKKLDNQTYASYDARFEEHVVSELIRNDGGEGEFDVITPPKLGIPETLMDGEADATWVFMPWEGVEAERDGIGLNAFSLEEYGVPYGYTPVLLTRPTTVEEESETLSAFLDATQRGYEFAADSPDEAAEILCSTADGPGLDDEAFVRASQREISAAYCADGVWGRMDPERWETFVDWLADSAVIETPEGNRVTSESIDVDALYTNALFD